MSAPTSSHGLLGYMSDQQVGQLLKPINGSRVSKDGKGFAHVEAYEIRAHLCRIFGIGRWSQEVLEQSVVFETSTDSEKPRWTVCYRSLVKLSVFDPHGTWLATYTEGATGDATNMPSRADAHDMALKTSQSQAFKRCAMNLGDQFGLSLYNKGSLRPLVMQTLVGMPDAVEQSQDRASVDAHITTPLAPENEAPADPQRETSSRPAPTVPAAPAPPAEPVAQEEQSPAESPAAADPEPAGAEPAAEDDTTAPRDDLEQARDAKALAQAEQVVADAFPGSEVEPEDPFADVLSKVNAAIKLPAAEALQKLHRCTELAVKYKLRERKVPDSEETLGAALMRLTKSAANAARKAG